jgi:ribosomal protein S18 acetylase RimI-like enzyme
MPQVELRAATRDDLDLLWRYLAIAAYEPDVAAARAVPFVAEHLDGWMLPGDFGFVAEADGVAVGAAWARHPPPDDNPFYVDDRTLEVSIGVDAAMRGQGVGARLMMAAIEEARRRGQGLCLNVRHDNPARRLYERLGFRLMPGVEVPNRVGGLSLGMVLSAPARRG